MAQGKVRKLALESAAEADLARPDHSLLMLADEVIRLNGRLRSIFEGTTAQSGLKAMEMAVLAAVSGAHTPPTVSQIGRSLGHPRQVIQRAANALVDADMITMTDNPDHKRAPLLIMTAAGEKKKAEADARAVEAADDLLESLDQKQCEQLTREMRVMRRKLEAHVRERDVRERNGQ